MLKPQEIEDRINGIRYHADPNSRFFGRILNWPDGYIRIFGVKVPFGVWHYGIGLSDKYVFETGAGLNVIKGKGKGRQFVKGASSYNGNPEETIERAIAALRCFGPKAEWEYNLFRWNCEHLARLIAKGKAKCYQPPGIRNRDAEKVFEAFLRRVPA